MTNGFAQGDEKEARPVNLRWLRWLAIALIVWAIISAFLLGTGYLDARNAQQQLGELQRGANGESFRSGEVDLRLADAAKSIDRAHDKFSNPLLYPLRVVPYVGRQFRSAIAVTGAAADVAGVAVDVVGEVRGVEDKIKSDRVGALRDLAQIANRSSARLQDKDLGPDSALIAPLAEARNETATQLSQARSSLEQGGAAAEALATMLGSNQRYLLLIANNGEMRSGAGMFLSTGLVSGQEGRIVLSDLQTIRFDARSDASVSWPQDLQDRWGWIGRQGDYRNLMLSPRFDEAAPIANEIWRKRGGQPVDGIVAVDPVFFRSLLRATGPVQVDGQTFSADNVMTRLLVDQYRNIDLTKSTVEAQLERRENLAGVAQGAFSALDAGSWEPMTMVRELASAASGRHLLVWASKPDELELWRKAGLTGELTANSLMVSSSNVGANKLDQFIEIDAHLDHRVGNQGRDMEVRLKMSNEMPGGLPGYVTGPTPGLGLTKGEYQGLLSVTVPGDAKDLRFEGKPPLVALGPDGPTNVIATKVQLKPGETREFTVKFTRSSQSRFTRVEPSARWPASNWTSAKLAWVDDSAQLVQH